MEKKLQLHGKQSAKTFVL